MVEFWNLKLWNLKLWTKTKDQRRRTKDKCLKFLCANLCNLWIIFKSQNLSAVADFQIETWNLKLWNHETRIFETLKRETRNAKHKTQNTKNFFYCMYLVIKRNSVSLQSVYYPSVKVRFYWLKLSVFVPISLIQTLYWKPVKPTIN